MAKQYVSERTGSNGFRVLAAVALCLGVLIFGTSPASAHAILTRVSPEPDAVLEESPEEISLSFTETISIPAQGIRLFDPSGSEVSGVTAVARGSTMTAQVPLLTTDGSYTVAWKAVSADGHAVSGAYLFHLRVATLTQPVAGAESGVALWPSLLRILGTVLSIGALALYLGRPRRRGLGLWAVASVGALVSLISSVAAAGPILSTGWSVSFSTSTGRLTVLALLLTICGLVVTLCRQWLARSRASGADEPTTPSGNADRALALLAVLTVAIIALEGHAVAINPVALSVTMTLGHVMAALCWGAGLVWLEARTRSASATELQAVVVRRSPWAIGAVVILGITGALLVLDRVPLNELLSSWYGRLGILKLVLLFVAVGLALSNRYRLTPKLLAPKLLAPKLLTETASDQAASAQHVPDQPASDQSVPGQPVPDQPAAVTQLRRSVRIEMLVLALALLLGATLAQVSPPQAGVGGIAGGSFSERAAFGTGQVELRLDPGLRGMNEVHVTALGSDGRLMPGVEELELSLSLAADSIGPLKPEMQTISEGHSVSYARFPFAGEWTVLVAARLSKFEAISAVFTVPIGTR
jgi:copper transport protein